MIRHHQTDLGNARLMVDEYGADLRRCHIYGTEPNEGWMIWDGQRWRVDRTSEVMLRAAMVPELWAQESRRLAAEAEKEADEAMKAELTAKSRALWAWSLRSESRAGQQAMITLARADRRVVVAPEQLDADRWLLNTPSGTVDLRSGRMHKHRREDLITRIAAAPYERAAKCPLWESFLLRIMCGRQDLADFLRRAMGYSLAGTVRAQVFMVLHGSGSNGKSTFMGTMQAVLGEYARSVNPELFMAKREGSIPNDLAALDGVRLVSASETKESKPLDEQTVKTVTGGDRCPISARFMRGEWFDYIPQFTAWLDANHRPIIKGTDLGIWRRIRLVPFDYSFDGKPDKDEGFGQKLLAEAPGILAWAVRGCLEWQEQGLMEPEDVLLATQEYRADMDILAAFLDDRTEAGPGYECENSTLYKAFSDWCEENGEARRSQRWFTRQLKKRGMEQVNANRRSWPGIRLLPIVVPDQRRRHSGWGDD